MLPRTQVSFGHTYYSSDLLVRHERLTHRKEQNKQQPPVESNHATEDDPPRKRMRASFDSVRPVPEIRSMMAPSPAILESDSSQYAPATPFNPLPTPENHSYSLTALSMAAEYQALHRDMASHNDLATHHDVTRSVTISSAPVSAALDDSQVVMTTDQIFNIPNATFDESLDNLASFLDNEPLSTYHFASMISAEQPM